MKWPLVNLTDLCDPKQWPTISSKQLTKDGYPVYGANGQIGFYSSYNHEQPTILITCRGATCGTVNISPPKCYVTGNAMALDNLKTEIIEFRFLYYALQARGLKDVITGAAQPQITRKNLSRVEIPLPPLSEQRRIVEILDQADALRKKRAEADKKAARILPALFYKMFGDPATNPKGWNVVTISNISKLVTSGLTPKGGAKNYVREGPYFLRSQNILMNQIDLSNIACIPNEIHETMHRTKVKFGDVLLNITGASIGRVAWYNIPNHEANVNQHVCIIRLNEKACPEYVSFFLSTPFGQILIKGAQTGATRQGLNHENVRKLSIPLPPVSLQAQFGYYARQINELHLKQRNRQRIVESLFKRILYHAFTGNLTAKWREAHMKELLEEMEKQVRVIDS